MDVIDILQNRLEAAWKVQRDMMDYARSGPPRQLTREKTAKEMVETFAYDLKEALEGIKQ